jgi:predicted DNA-binding transcriptional regulator AlpA
MLMAVSDRPQDKAGELMGAQEIRRLFGVSRQRVQQIVSRPDFPRPVAELAIKVWRGEDVRAWAREHRPDIDTDS